MYAIETAWICLEKGIVNGKRACALFNKKVAALRTAAENLISRADGIEEMNNSAVKKVLEQALDSRNCEHGCIVIAWSKIVKALGDRKEIQSAIQKVQKMAHHKYPAVRSSSKIALHILQSDKRLKACCSGFHPRSHLSRRR
jgi:hypothetical protein